MEINNNNKTKTKPPTNLTFDIPWEYVLPGVIPVSVTYHFGSCSCVAMVITISFGNICGQGYSFFCACCYAVSIIIFTGIKVCFFKSQNFVLKN